MQNYNKNKKMCVIEKQLSMDCLRSVAGIVLTKWKQIC